MNMVVRDYIALTKPRIMVLLLLTSVTGMVLAAGGFPDETARADRYGRDLTFGEQLVELRAADRQDREGVGDRQEAVVSEAHGVPSPGSSSSTATISTPSYYRYTRVLVR